GSSRSSWLRLPQHDRDGVDHHAVALFTCFTGPADTVCRRCGARPRLDRRYLGIGMGKPSDILLCTSRQVAFLDVVAEKMGARVSLDTIGSGDIDSHPDCRLMVRGQSE